MLSVFAVLLGLSPSPRAALKPSPANLSLFRGCFVSGSQPPYEDVEDTTLDQDDPTAANGGFYTLDGGPNSTILVRFGSLNTVIPPHTHIVQASLVLTLAEPGKPTLESISMVRKGWNEGPATSLVNILPPVPPKATGKPGPKPAAIATPWGAACWNAAWSGVPNGKWQEGGAHGASDATPLSGVTDSSTDTTYTLKNLGAAVEEMRKNPGRNFGFSLHFLTPVSFDSSDASEGQPKLTLVLAPDAPDGSYKITSTAIDPSTGEESATLLPAGTQPAPGARFTWRVNGSITSQGNIPASNTDAPVTIPGPKVATDPKNPRFGEASLEVDPAGTWQPTALNTYPGGIPISVNITLPAGTALADSDIDAWAEKQVQALNDIYLARSRYTATPDGCLERVFLRAVTIGSVAGSTGDAVSVSYALTSADLEDPISTGFAKAALVAIGAPDLGLTDFPPGSPKVKVTGYDQGGLSWYPGVTGGGDTRFDGLLPPMLSLGEEAYYDPSTATLPVITTGLISKTGAWVLNHLIGLRGAERSLAALQVQANLPKVTLVRALDPLGNPLKGTELTFYQDQSGVVTNQPAFTVLCSADGVAVLPNRPIDPKAPKGAANVFASDNMPADGAFLVRATLNGDTEWSWLKAWQLEDLYARGTKSAAIISLRFNLPQAPVDRTTNFALNRAVTDSANDPPAVLSGLVGAQPADAPVSIGAAGGYFEIDLNRDHAIDEITITTKKGAMYPKFHILVYGTGQQPSDGLIWAREIDARWTENNRAHQLPNGEVQFVYHGPVYTSRFIRIVNDSPDAGAIQQIAVYGAAN